MLRLAFLLCFLFAPLAFAQPAAQEVTFAGAGGLTLNGTLLMPQAKEGGAPAPGVLLLPGSGPTDRDGNQPPGLVTDLLKQIAERLAAEGVATLRFDKRATRGYSAQWPKTPEEIDSFFSFENFVGDATLAYRFLRSSAGVNPARVAILGHSEGGLIALQIGADLAASEDRPAALILAGTAGRLLGEVLRDQFTAALSRPGVDEATRRTYLDAMERAVTALKASKPLPKDLPADLLAALNPSVQKLLHAYVTIDPAALAANVRGPVLVIQGEKDAQVSARLDTPRLESALKPRAGQLTEVFIVPEASHNLKISQGALDPAVTGPVSPAALDRVSTWILAQLAPPK